jgi:hypothetical protein
LSQELANTCVANTVAVDFATPVFRIAFRHTQVLWAAVPKAAIDKYDQAPFTEHEVSVTSNRRVTSPTPYAVFAKNSHQS